MAINNSIDVKIQGSYGFDQSSAGGAGKVHPNLNPKTLDSMQHLVANLRAEGKDVTVTLCSSQGGYGHIQVKVNDGPKVFQFNDENAKTALKFMKEAETVATVDPQAAKELQNMARNLLSQSKRHTRKMEKLINQTSNEVNKNIAETEVKNKLKADHLAKNTTSQKTSSDAPKLAVETPSQPASPASVETKQATTVETPKETPLPSMLKAQGEKPQNIKHAMFPAEVTSMSSKPAAPKNVKISADFVKNNNYNTLSRDLATKTFQATNKANWNDQYLGSLTNSINNLNRFINIFSDANAKGSPGEQGASIDNYRPSKAECESLKKQLTQLKDNIKEFGFQRVNIPQSLRDIEQRKKIAQEGNARNEGFKNISNQIDTLLNKLNSITEFNENDTPSVGRNFLNQMEKSQNDGVRPADQDLKDAQYMAKMWGYDIK